MTHQAGRNVAMRGSFWVTIRVLAAGLTAMCAAEASRAGLDIMPGAAESAGLAAHTKTAAGETPTAV